MLLQFLTSSEIEMMDLGEFGAARDMMSVPPQFKPPEPYAFPELMMRRADLMFLNLIVGRVLVPQVILQPWDAQTERPPKRNVVNNLKVRPRVPPGPSNY